MSNETSGEAVVSKPSFLVTFGKHQVSSLAATAVDYSTTVALVELFGVWYVAATACGAFLGAVTNFLMGRHWTFKAHVGIAHHQALKYAVVSATSLLINTSGVYFFTDHVHLPYLISKILMGILVSVLFNFPMHRGFVFR